MDNEFILKARDLTVELDHQIILDKLSFSVKKGDIVSILGPNGAGKTVLLKCLLGLLPYEGEILWKKDIKIGYVPQRLPFIKDIPLSVGEFFSLKRASNQVIDQIMSAVGLNHGFLVHRMSDLSSGQFQRLLIAWSLVGKPDVLLFGEPTTGIDIGGEETIYTLLDTLKKDWLLTMLLVTHDLNVVYQFSNQVICLNKKAVCIGPAKNVLTPESLQQLYGGGIKYYLHKH
ncbi:metal ABC transporter ATP-binding protein [Legionella longbeachae]|uniref:metal ABC transporter ATP-binding protein n=1 Tax=Legionella longbeachae TaxID=450 RepID=UPI001245DB0B|nr:metal ABC transporter ATP-binding protein [Legionella longbeachae]QEY52701.1 metal ABC transporter ATP-binding protein [Legionella longbeachae]